MFYFGKKNILFAVALFLTGCANITGPQLKLERNAKQKSSFIVLRTPALRYSDQGFVAKSNNKVDVQIYSNGVASMKLDITPAQVCSGSGLFKCMSSKQFNAKYLNASYPKDTLYHIFTAQRIFGGKGLQKLPNGFAQHIQKSGNYDIEYKILNNTIVFRDKISNILIKIREN